MKVIYVGHYRNGNTGWANASKNTILAMNSVGIDVACRAIETGSYIPSINDDIKALEEKSKIGCDICIQNVLPQFLEYNGNYKKNIAYCVYEMLDASMSTWGSRINLMDELWTVNEYSKRCFESMGVTIPIKIVPYAFPQINTNSIDKISHPSLDGNYIFYTIADLNKRKDILSTVKAFHIAFTPNEPVSLMIKTSKSGMSGHDCAKAVIEDCKRVKTNMKLYKNIDNYLDEVIIGDELSEEDMMSVHRTGDCFICTSHGESWNIPLYQSIILGKSAIYSESHPFNDYINNELTYKDSQDCVFEMTETFPDISSSRESWSIANVKDIASKMILAYTNYRDNNLDSNKRRSEMSKIMSESFTYEVVGNIIKEQLTV